VTSAEALAMVPVADRASRVLLSPSASQPQLSGISSNFYRVFPSDASEGTMMANFARQTLELAKVVVLAKEETYAKGAQEVFRERFTELGGQVVEVLAFPPNTVDFSGLVERVGTVNPDAVYIAAYASEIVNLVKALRAQGFVGSVLTTSSFSTTDAISQAGPAAEGVYFTQTAFAPTEKNPEVEAFVSAYKAKYRSEPDLYAAHGYDAYRVLLAAMKESGKGASDFWKGMRGISDFPGVTGTFQFDEKGDVKKFPRVFMVREGQVLDLEKAEEARREEIRRKMREIQEELVRLRAQGGGG
jgi:branched-chain amino acid transport system substrate-binding protein